MRKSLKFTLGLLVFFVAAVFFTYSPYFLASNKTFSFYVIHTYISSPGFVTYESYGNFTKTRERCQGATFLLNRKATHVDAPGISLCIGLLSSPESGMSNAEIVSGVQENNVPVVPDLSNEFAGEWVSMGNDVFYIELDLKQDGFFEEYISSVDTGKSKNLTGKWKLKEEFSNKYLVLIYDEDISVPTEQDQIDRYKEYGEEFIGNNQRISKINPYSSLPNTFRVYGVLMERKSGI